MSVQKMSKTVVAKGAHGVNKLQVFKFDQPITRENTKIVVFFLGDRIEQYGVDPEIMKLQDPAEVSRILAEKFPAASAICVVSPSHMEGGCACYRHFFDKLTLTGEPLGYSGRSFKASEQLQSLLSAAGLWPTTPSSPSGSRSLPAVEVIGFSKGGIVINKLVAELAELASVSDETLPPPPSAPLLRSLRRLHFLDAGLNCRGAYITDARSIEKLGTWCAAHPGTLSIALHGTPRQWNDPRRPLLAAERDRMLQLCALARISTQVKEYFQGRTPSTLRMHFDIIKAMDPACLASP